MSIPKSYVMPPKGVSTRNRQAALALAALLRQVEEERKQKSCPNPNEKEASDADR